MALENRFHLDFEINLKSIFIKIIFRCPSVKLDTMLSSLEISIKVFNT